MASSSCCVLLPSSPMCGSLGIGTDHVPTRTHRHTQAQHNGREGLGNFTFHAGHAGARHFLPCQHGANAWQAAPSSAHPSHISTATGCISDLTPLYDVPPMCSCACTNSPLDVQCCIGAMQWCGSVSSALAPVRVENGDVWLTTMQQHHKAQHYISGIVFNGESNDGVLMCD
jgi:hypothetical protein